MKIQQFVNNSVGKILKLTIASFFLVPLVFTANSKDACACSCAPLESPKAEFNRSQAVFSGTVIRSRETGEKVQVKLRIAEIWKGDVTEIQSITTWNNSAACGLSFERGKKYLIYASKIDDRPLVTSLCTRTKLFANAEQDLLELGESKSSAKRIRRRTEAEDK